MVRERVDVFHFMYTVLDDAGGVSRQMANWLKNASTVSAPNPNQRQILRGGKAKGVRCSQCILKNSVHIIMFLNFSNSLLL